MFILSTTTNYMKLGLSFFLFMDRVAKFDDQCTVYSI